MNLLWMCVKTDHANCNNDISGAQLVSSLNRPISILIDDSVCLSFRYCVWQVKNVLCAFSDAACDKKENKNYKWGWLELCGASCKVLFLQFFCPSASNVSRITGLKHFPKGHSASALFLHLWAQSVTYNCIGH